MADQTRRDFFATAGALSAAVLLPPISARAAASGAPPDAGLAFASATELVRLLGDGSIGSEELTRFYIRRIERYDEELNAIVVRDFERALTAARAADRARAAGRVLGPLHGLPMTVKESYNVGGLPTTWGVPAHEHNIATEDALVVQRCKAAGAHFMGKTNVPYMLGDFQSYNDIYGTTNNPWDVERTPGGSSGGTAAALAAGLTGLDSGSDIGGSIRNPAHYCGVYGHKPTWGVVPPRGEALPGMLSDTDLAVVGPLARSAEDLALAMGTVAGADPLRAAGWNLALPPPRMTRLDELRVALWPDQELAPVSREIADRVVAVGEVLSRLGAKVSDTARPGLPVDVAHQTYQKLLLAIVGGEEDNIPYQQWMRLDNQRTGYRLAWQAFFEDWDVLVCPIMATTAFRHDHRPYPERTIDVNGEPRSYFQQVFWAGLATLCYLPATVFPTGPSEAGLPIGLQAIGAAYDDRTTIDFARLIAAEMGGFVPPPGFAS